MKATILNCATKLLLFAMAVFADIDAFADVQSATNVTENHATATTANSVAPVTLLTNIEFWLSVLVLLFGMAVLFFQYILLKSKDATPNDVMKAFTVTLIVVGVLFSVTAGFSAQTVAPALGLFGTIAGYLLGKRDTSDSTRQEQP